MKIDPRESVLELVALVGRSEARTLLVLEGVSPHTADKLTAGKYPSRVGKLMGDAIERVLSSVRVRVS